ncbi:glycoside hydrolase family 32 protein [Streptomyces sp. B-S-A8]|uniref:Glycoside hydrolase family 32 protein n=1 Tax=Streptomyces solicavernae TaxID=3043614 RepID=A0ABT6RVJ1_9ACTN|nr:glycoside hydrolase family 32 protein [Streptomyces sp. B-S-A8]MDI3388459.1 glycoside hydrolase family 32 protein [Streptomyces sp. B-S-A8]
MPFPSRRSVLSSALGLSAAAATTPFLCTTAAAAPAVRDASGLRAETYRPRLHFSPARNWTNDPNGLIFHEGRWHLFFQYNPEGDVWGNMSWGHAVSSDLVQWEERPVAIAHDDQEMIFSGSVVYDERNTSGLGSADRPPLVAVYTSTLKDDSGLQRQSLAYSTDAGETWTKYAGNPVLDIGARDFRDPSVFWHADSGRWVMALALPTEYKIRFYASDDLKSWRRLSDFGPLGATGGIWECPNLFPLGDRWVLLVSLNPGGPAGGSATQYFTGTFDGTAFTPDAGQGTRWVDWGADCYAGITYNDAPDGRRVFVPWMNNWLYADRVPTSPWRGAMGFPRELTLRDGRLRQRPVRELESHRTRRLLSLTGETAPEGTRRLLADTGQLYELQAVLAPGSPATSDFGVDVRSGGGAYTRIGYDTVAGELYIDRRSSGAVGFAAEFPGVHRAPVALPDGGLDLRVLVDASSVEVYAAGGTVCLTDQIFPDPDACGLRTYARGGALRIETLTARSLRPARPGH